MKFFFTLILFSTTFGFSQEICDNGNDDDNDELIDLLDPDCQCGAGIIEIELSNVVPNPNFDNFSCCPVNNPISINCLNDWHNSNPLWNIYAEYANSCNLCDNGSANWDPIADLPLDCANPIPNGLLSLAYYGNTNEYIYNDFASVCLNVPLTPNLKYRLQFNAYRPYIYPRPGFPNSNTGVVQASLHGTTDCSNVPMLNSGCVSNPFWTSLDDIYDSIPLDSKWHEYSYFFKPSTAISAFGLGPTCGAGSHITPNKKTVHYFMDSIKLFYAPDFTITILDSGSFCNNNLKLYASIDSNFNGSWQWYKDSIAIVGEVDDSIDISNLGSGNYTALYLLNGNCQGETVFIPPSEFPIAFNIAPFEECQNSPSLFDGVATVNSNYGNYISHYKWDFGNGNFAYSEDTLYAFPASGTYNTELIAFSNKGCSDTAKHTIIINPTPSVSFLSNNNCSYDSIQFINTSTIVSGNIANINWDFGNNTNAQDSIKKIKFLTPGSHQIKLTAMSNIGCKDSLELPLFINPKPNAQFSANDTCTGLQVSFTNQSSILFGNINNYFWNFGNNINSIALSPTTSFNTEGTYSTELIIVSDSGCRDTSNLQLEIHPIPTANFTNSIICLETSFENTSSITSGSINSVNWNFGDTKTSNITSPNHKYQVAGDYIVNLSTLSNFGCINDTSFTITTSSEIDIEINSSANNVCANDCIELDFESTPNLNEATYLWKFSNGQSSKAPSPYICLTNKNNYTDIIDVNLYIDSEFGCKDSLKMNQYISVIPVPKAKFNCSPKKAPLKSPIVEFQNQSTNAVYFDWNFGDNTASIERDPIHTYPYHASLYSAVLTVHDSSKTCHDQYRLNIEVVDEIILFIPNAFTPLNSSQNNIFQPVITSGVNIYKYKLEIFNRWGEVLFISHNPEIGWNGTYQGKMVKPGAYIWKIDFIETMSDKSHALNGSVILVN